jgi:hypothetical protein
MLSRNDRDGGRDKGTSDISRSVTPTIWSASIISRWWVEFDLSGSVLVLSRRIRPAPTLARPINNKDPNNKNLLGTL